MRQRRDEKLCQSTMMQLCPSAITSNSSSGDIKNSGCNTFMMFGTQVPRISVDDGLNHRAEDVRIDLAPIELSGLDERAFGSPIETFHFVRRETALVRRIRYVASEVGSSGRAKRSTDPRG
jgi:hypothetical protein